MLTIIGKSLGLSNNERAVLKVLYTQKRPRNISNIAKHADIPRTTTDYILRKFQERRLVKRTMIGKRYYWKYNKSLDRPEIKTDPKDYDFEDELE